MEKQYKLIKRNYESGKIEYVIQKWKLVDSFDPIIKSSVGMWIDHSVFDNEHFKDAEKLFSELSDEVMNEEEISPCTKTDIEKPEDEFIIPNKETIRKQFEDETGKKYMFSNDSFYPLADYYLSYSEWLEKQVEFYSIEYVKEKIDCKKRIKEAEETVWNASREMDITLHIDYLMWDDIEHWRKWRNK